jgi:hypothetical protein
MKYLSLLKKNKFFDNEIHTNDYLQNQNSSIKNNTEENIIGKDKYIEEGVYHIDALDGSISILKKIPGNSKAEKTKNIALIVLHIKKEPIHASLIIPLCEKHNCYDQANFSSMFKNEKTNIVRKGSGKAWTIELTKPGKEAAIKLLEDMVNASK